MKFTCRFQSIGTLVIVLLLAMAAHGAESTAKFASVKGDVQVRSQGGAWAKASKGQKAAVKDEVRCGANSEAVLAWESGHAVKLNASTQISVEAMSRQADGKESVKLGLAQGSMHAKVKKLSAGSEFEIKSPTALAGVRGTDFFVSLESVQVLDGSVLVSAGGTDIIVEAGFFVAIAEPGQAPSEPAPIPPDTLKELKSSFEQFSQNAPESPGKSAEAGPAEQQGNAGDSAAATIDAPEAVIDTIDNILDQNTVDEIINQVTEADLLEGMGGADIELYY